MMSLHEALTLQAALNQIIGDFTRLHCDVANRPDGGRVHNWASSQQVGGLRVQEGDRLLPASLAICVATPDLL